jgi:peptide deformylase
MPIKPPELLDIVLYPDPFLTKPCKAVMPAEIQAGKALAPTARGTTEEVELAALVERMIATMRDAEGIGLAAPQVGIGLKLFVADISDDHTQPFVVINPVFSDMKGTLLEEEGCLSIPGVRAKVKRHAALHVSGLDLKGQPMELDATELLSRVCQHETDHLNGVLFINKIGMTAKLLVRRQLIELEEDYAIARKRAKK